MDYCTKIRLTTQSKSRENDHDSADGFNVLMNQSCIKSILDNRCRITEKGFSNPLLLCCF